MYQQSLDLQFPLTQQLNLDLNVSEEIMTYLGSPYIVNSELIMTDGFNGTVNSYFTVGNTNGLEQVRIDDSGLSINVENKSWLKAKVANWLGLKYL